MAWAALATAAAGAIAGGQKDNSGGTSGGSSNSSVMLRGMDYLNKGRSDVEATADKSSLDIFKTLENLLKLGPGESEISANTTFQNQFADQLQQLFQTGGMPNQNQVAQANQYANQMFAPQQTALDQQFEDHQVQSKRLAAKLGRPGNDPILRNKMIQEQTRQQRLLDSQKGAFGSQFAQQLPQQMMDIGGMLSNLRSGLATQAFQNRQSLLTMGQQLVQNERNYRVSTANRYGESQNRNWAYSGGGAAGAINGGIAGLGAGMSMMGGGGFGGFGGGGSSMMPATGGMPGTMA